MEELRVCVLGAGGIGCWIASRLAMSGKATTLIARGAGLAALQQKGLTALGPDGEVIGVAREPALRAVGSAADVGGCDVLFVAVKTHQLDACIPIVAGILRHSPGALVVPCLNGVEASAILRAGVEHAGLPHAGPNIMGGLARCIVYVREPGTVVLEREPGMAVGPASPDASPEQIERLRNLSAFMTAAGIACELVPTPEALHTALWCKWLVTGCIGPLSAAMRAPIDVVLHMPETRQLVQDAMEEMRAVGVAGGVAIDSDAPQRALALASRASAGSTYSTTRDILSGRPSELLEFSGTLVRLGRERSVPTPVHSQLLATLLPQERLARGEVSFTLRGL